MDWAQWLAIGMIGAASVIFLPMWLIAAISELLTHRREMKQGGANIEAIVKQLQALREELNALRETSTEHHLSLQEQVEALQERVRALEAEQHLHR
jgi:polyhydroxyalkanoate synthesis regulator phasin